MKYRFDFLADLEDVHFPGYEFEVRDKDGQLFLIGHFHDSEDAPQTTRKWYLSPHMTKSEFIQTVFKCVLTSQEHEAREAFKYRGKAIFGPHFDVDSLHQIAGKKCHLDYRTPIFQDGVRG
jgi:hypothetical protein